MSDYITPVMHVDPSGESFLLILGCIAVGGILSGLASMITATENENLLGAFVGGFINGAFNTAGLAAALATGGAGAILWAGGMGFAGGFLGNTVNQLISFDHYDPMISILSGGISATVNLALLWGVSTYAYLGNGSWSTRFIEALIPSMEVIGLGTYLGQFKTNPNKLHPENYSIAFGKVADNLRIDFAWR